jgi:hypothetical protein
MTITLSCHCGGTRIELPEAPTAATLCTCSYCTKSGGLWAYYAPEAPRIVSATHSTLYAPSEINEHYFCSKCGCTTHGISPDWSLADTEIPEKKKFSINVKLLDDYALYRTLPVTEIDGRNLW